MARSIDLRLAIDAAAKDPVVVADPSGPCPTCNFSPHGTDTPVMRAWRRIIPEQSGLTTWWLGHGGDWACKTCHPPGDPKSVAREVIIRGVAEEK